MLQLIVVDLYTPPHTHIQYSAEHYTHTSQRHKGWGSHSLKALMFCSSGTKVSRSQKGLKDLSKQNKRCLATSLHTRSASLPRQTARAAALSICILVADTCTDSDGRPNPVHLYSRDRGSAPISPQFAPSLRGANKKTLRESEVAARFSTLSR